MGNVVSMREQGGDRPPDNEQAAVRNCHEAIPGISPIIVAPEIRNSEVKQECTGQDGRGSQTGSAQGALLNPILLDSSTSAVFILFRIKSFDVVILSN